MSAPENIRCPHCDRLLDTAPMLEAGDCGCRWQHGDVVQNPLTGRHFVAEWDRYAKRCHWLELAPLGHSQLNPPAGAVLVMRWVEGKPMPVVSLGDGDLFAIETVA